MDDNFRMPSKEELSGEKKMDNYGFRTPSLEELKEVKKELVARKEAEIMENYGFYTPTGEEFNDDKHKSR